MRSGRIARPPGSHRARLHDRHAAGAAAASVWTPADTRVVIQGFGNVGGMAAKLMARAGFKIVCIIEYDGAVYNPNGLDIAALHEASQGDRLHHRFRGRRRHRSRPRRCSCDCDVLLPAATENVITSAQCGSPALQDPLRRRQRPHHAGGRCDSGGQEDLRDSRYSGQRRRRHGFLLRMGAGPPGLLLERASW